MRASGLVGSAIGMTVLSSCILAEADKVGAGGAGGGPSASSGSPASVTSAGGTGGGGGSGGMGGMGGAPPTCTTPEPGGTVLWSKHIAGDGVPGTAHQRITRLIGDPEGIVVMGQYTEALSTNGFSAPSVDGSGNAFLVWVEPGGSFVQDGGAAKNVLFFGPPAMGAPPEPRAVALGASPYGLAVVGRFEGSLMASGTTVNAPSAEPAAFTVDWDDTAATPGLWADATSVAARFDDVVVAADGARIVSGYTQNGMTVGGAIFPLGHFIARIEQGGAVAVQSVLLGTGTAASERIHLAPGPNDAIYLAAALRQGTHLFGSDTLQVDAISGVLVGRIDPNLNFTGANVFQGPDTTGHQVFVWDLTAGPNGRAAVSGSFFGQMSFEPDTAKIISTAAGGQNDGFVVVIDPSLEATQWFGLGSTTTNEVIASVSIDPCGDVAVMGTLRGEAMFGGAPVSPESAAAAYVAKFDASMVGALSPAWIALLDHASHTACSTSTAVAPFWDQPCFHVLASADGVYAAGGFSGQIDLPGGPTLAASQGEDAYLLKLAP